MLIRQYVTDDLASVVSLWTRCGLVTSRNDPELDIARKLQVDPELLLVGLDDDMLVATVMGGYEGHRGWINYLAVTPGRQRRGYGRRMLQAVEERLQAKGCPKINLQVRRDNPDAIGFYTALGYLDDEVIGLGKRLLHDGPQSP